jgi:hypothetical protein
MKLYMRFSVQKWLDGGSLARRAHATRWGIPDSDITGAIRKGQILDNAHNCYAMRKVPNLVFLKTIYITRLHLLFFLWDVSPQFFINFLLPLQWYLRYEIEKASLNRQERNVSSRPTRCSYAKWQNFLVTMRALCWLLAAYLVVIMKRCG